MVKICRVIRIKLNQLVYENVRTIAILLGKWRLLTSEQQTFRIACPTKWLIWRNYVTVTLCILKATQYGTEPVRCGCLWGCIVAQPGEYDGTVPVRRRCSLLSNFFDHSFIFRFQKIECSSRKLIYRPFISVYGKSKVRFRKFWFWKCTNFCI